MTGARASQMRKKSHGRNTVKQYFMKYFYEVLLQFKRTISQVFFLFFFQRFNLFDI